MGSNGMNKITVGRKFKAQSSAVQWLGQAWLCPKQLKHYAAFSSNGNMISAYTFAFIMHEDKDWHYLGYLEDVYEDKRGEKKVEVRWLCHNQEVKQVIPELDAHPEEVFMTPDIQVLGAEYIVSVVTVLNPSHYEKHLGLSPLFPEELSSGIFLCHREFKKNKVKPFSLSKLRGYQQQRLVLLLDSYADPKNKAKLQKSNEAKEDFPSEVPAKLVTRKIRSRRAYQKQDGARSDAPNSSLENQSAKHEPLKLKLKLSKGPSGNKNPSGPSSQDEKNIELLSQDSGLRGCWFRCKILKTSLNRVKVRYYDVQDVDGPGKLEEWVPASRVAAPDRLKMRCAGRMTMRPWPPRTLDDYFEIGDAVDAWWCDGWWECVVIGFDNSGSDDVQVYLPGENKFLSFNSKDLRTSRDWINDKWMEIEAKPDILSIIGSTTGRGKNVLKQPTSIGASKQAGSKLADDKEPPKSSKPSAPAPKDGMKKLAGSGTSTERKGVEQLNFKKKMILAYNDELARGEFGKSSEDDDGDQEKARPGSVLKCNRRRKLVQQIDSDQSSG